MSIEDLVGGIRALDKSTPLSDLGLSRGREDIKPLYNGLNPKVLKEITSTLNAYGRAGVETIADLEERLTKKHGYVEGVSDGRKKLAKRLFLNESLEIK